MHCLHCRKEKVLFAWWFSDLFCSEECFTTARKEMQERERKRQHLAYLSKPG